MKLLVIFAVVCVITVESSKVPIPKARFITENQKLTEAEQKTKFVEYLNELNGVSKEELDKKTLDEILEDIISILTDRKELQYLRASAIRKHLKYFIGHRENHVPKLPKWLPIERIAADEEEPPKATSATIVSDIQPAEVKSATTSEGSDSSDFTSYLVRYVHSLDGTVEEALSLKPTKELIDTAIAGLKKRLSDEKDPEQAELIKKHIAYFESAKTRQ